MRKRAFIYKITNVKNQFSYIGATTENPPTKRWKRHLAVARSPETYAHNHTFQKLHQAIKEEGEEHFNFEVLEETTPGKRFAREKHWVRKVGSFGQYNSTLGGKGTPGLAITEENKEKSRQLSRELMSGPQNPMWGKHQSEYTKQRIREGHQKAKARRDRVKGEKNPFFGQKHSEEARALMKEAWEDREYKREWVLARTKLSKEDVEAIREAYKNGARVKELAEKYGISISGIYKVLKQERAVDQEDK